jgi:hypothetical protein
MRRVPVRSPVAVGLKSTVSVQLAPGATDMYSQPPLNEKSLSPSVTPTFAIFSEAVPVLMIVSWHDATMPMATVGQSRADGEELICGCGTPPSFPPPGLDVPEDGDGDGCGCGILGE